MTCLWSLLGDGGEAIYTINQSKTNNKRDNNNKKKERKIQI